MARKAKARKRRPAARSRTAGRRKPAKRSRKARPAKGRSASKRAKRPKTKRGKMPIKYNLREVPIKSVKVWRAAQARKLDREGVAELARTIKSEGLQNPPMVQKEGKHYMLMSGQRRLAALKRLGFKRIPVLLLTKKTAFDLEDAKAASVIENVHRKGMNTKEMAESCVFLAENLKSQSKAAKTIGVSIPTFKKLHGFAGVPDKIKALVPKTLTRDEATKLHIAVSNVNRAVQVAERIAKHPLQVRKQYVQILGANPRMSHAAILKRAKKVKTRRKITVELSKTQARKLDRIGERQDLYMDELAKKVLGDWLKKRK